MADLKHNSSKYPKLLLPQYTKVVTEELAISLSYLDQSNTECLLSFHNISDSFIKVNPQESTNKGWFDNMFGTSKSDENGVEENFEASLLQNSDSKSIKNEPISIFLGYMQLLGYVLLNYKFDFNDETSDIGGGKSQELWKDHEYIEQYSNYDYPGKFNRTNDENIYEKLDKVPFIYSSYKDRMVIGGKMGGINDLIVEADNASTTVEVDESKLYFLNDLAFGFNSRKYNGNNNSSKKSHREERWGESKENLDKTSIGCLTNAILPFYATSQSLLFSDLTLKPKETKTFNLQIPQIKDLPPSYNHRSTGITGDQGLISIKYSLIVGVSGMEETGLQSRSIYFPFEVKTDPIGGDYALPDYLQRTIINYNWEVNNLEKTCQNSLPIAKDPLSDSLSTSNKIRSIEEQNFALELRELIESDLYNMPKVSTAERRKSIQSSTEKPNNNLSLIPQISAHQKTQYQIRLNKEQICTVNISKPNFQIGDDISFALQLTDNTEVRIIGFIVHIEAQEKFKFVENDLEQEIKHTYKVSPNIKYNVFASAIFNQQETTINGMINIPNHLTPQFQSSRLFELSYSLVFKFNILKFTKDKVHYEEISSNSFIDDIDNSSKEDPSREPHAALQKFKQLQVNNEGSEFTFKLPLILL